MNATSSSPPAAAAITEDDIARLQSLLDELPAPLEPLDVSMLDGYLCGVLLQPKAVPVADWLPAVLDVEGRPLPAGAQIAELQTLVLRRHAELAGAIARRDWFDPWVYELDDDVSPSDTVMPWVAGFATACGLFPALMQISDPEMLEPLAMLYAHLDADDLEDADELIAEIETLEPPQDLSEAVEALVRATLLLADVSLPRKPAARMPARPPARKGPPPKGRNRRF